MTPLRRRVPQNPAARRINNHINETKNLYLALLYRRFSYSQPPAEPLSVLFRVTPTPAVALRILAGKP
jgi:hypothetical protein